MSDQPDMFATDKPRILDRVWAPDPAPRWMPSPDYLASREYYEKHFPEQNQRYATTPEPNAQGELGMSDHSNVEHAKHNLKEAQREEKKHELDFWERRAQVGRTAHDAHIHAEKEEKTKSQQP